MPSEERSQWKTVVISAVAAVLIGAFAVGVVGLIWLTEPEAEREGAVKRTPMLVEVVTAESGTFRPTLTALGTVRAVEDVMLQPRVSGQVVDVSRDFVPGQVVARGTTLVRIDPADAQNQVAQRTSALDQAKAALALEKGRQAAAQTERAQFAGEVSAAQEALITRVPQLQSAQATVASAMAGLRQAELELARTRVTAPMDALVLERTVGLGSQVTPGTTLGRLVGVEEFWVELTLPTQRLAHLPTDLGSLDTPVLLHDRAAWSAETRRTGQLKSVVRQVDDRTRLARLLVSVSDPLALDPATEGPPLTAGAWVEATLPGQELVDVVRLDRSMLRKDDTVWEMDTDGKLRIRPVQVLVEDDAFAYLAGGIEPGATIVSSDLATVAEGAQLRTGRDTP